MFFKKRFNDLEEKFRSTTAGIESRNNSRFEYLNNQFNRFMNEIANLNSAIEYVREFPLGRMLYVYSEKDGCELAYDSFYKGKFVPIILERFATDTPVNKFAVKELDEIRYLVVDTVNDRLSYVLNMDKRTANKVDMNASAIESDTKFKWSHDFLVTNK